MTASRQNASYNRQDKEYQRLQTEVEIGLTDITITLNVIFMSLSVSEHIDVNPFDSRAVGIACRTQTHKDTLSSSSSTSQSSPLSFSRFCLPFFFSEEQQGIEGAIHLRKKRLSCLCAEDEMQ